ncbi:MULTISPECIES: hypothetical protein [Microbacterium]|uniref:Uncharacterized protein n=1 Tax=Microbacterium trichothecenolyticum TaxID=69370 RepID=A0A0M2H9R8_MICTR|nr:MULTISPECIES: hypothetical protein [Microbacterium]KJL40750.1 hypothetical protein RS82_03366 [Microbacterium trichothecenolyticum]MDR7188632.1 hypothetical protein [Microbacterium sp. BE35]
MARTGGRNSWIAVPAGILCAAVVASLVWLALPMVPVAVAWVGDTLRSATAPRPEATPAQTPAQTAADGGAIDCRTLYADDLWNELTWREGSLLDQSMAAPATAATAFADAAAPDVLVTCTWRFDSGGIVTTLSKVDADAATIAEAALAGDGFSCRTADGATVCDRTRGAVLEEHTLRDGLWLVSVETAWHPDDYGRRLDHTVWG